MALSFDTLHATCTTASIFLRLNFVPSLRVLMFGLVVVVLAGFAGF